ncbi:MAG TPA: ATP-binding protein [Polyangia bacterium]|nr:ATP-binding protein [Polyangia bacterium]
MLADVLDGTRDQLAAQLARCAGIGGPADVVGARQRRERLRALVEEAIQVLRHGGVDDPAQPCSRLTPTAEQPLELVDRELVQRYLLGQIEQHHLQASADETGILAKWAGQAERKRLREQNQRLCALLDDVKENVVLLAPDGRILYCNLRAFQRLHELARVNRDEIIGRTFAEIGVSSEFLVGCPVDRLEAMARTHEAVEMQILGRTKESQFDAVYRPDGSVAAVAVLIRDIHNRKLAEVRLALLTKLSALVGMSDPDVLAESLAQVPIPELADWCSVNLIEDGRIRRTYVAQRDPSQAPLRDAIMRLTPTWDRHPLWQELLNGGFQLLAEVTDDLLRKLAPNDDYHRLLSQVGIRSLIVVPLATRGQIIGIGTCAYTTESGRRYGRDDPALAEELALHAAHAFENARLMRDLKTSEERFRVALAGAQTSVFEQDASLRYVWAYHPSSPFEMVGRTHEEAFPPDEAAMLTTFKRHVVEAGESVQREMDATFGSGELRHYRETIEPRRDRGGNVVGLIGAATDLTEQHRMRQQLTEELGFREKMMGILSHDLGNPLTAIVMAVDLMLHRGDLSPAGRDQALRIRRSAGRMAEMIGTLLDFTRMRSRDKLSVTPVATDLGEIARDAVDEVRVAWPDQPIELDAHGDAHGEWDPARMAQTVSNLVSNAITYGERGTAVKISVEGGEREVTLRVHNVGPPIAAELRSVLFQPFRRAGLEDRSPRGLGLGLYIVEQIVLAHGGTIDVDSTAENGTTFTVHLPRAPAVALKAGAA